VKYGGSLVTGSLLYSILHGCTDQQVARNLLTYRYNQLDKAIENAEKILGSKRSSSLSMVTMNGENVIMNGEITHEEIHKTERLLLLFF
jgi:maltose phosphorylase